MEGLSMEGGWMSILWGMYILELNYVGWWAVCRTAALGVVGIGYPGL